jgi:hypothetical protein
VKTTPPQHAAKHPDGVFFGGHAFLLQLDANLSPKFRPVRKHLRFRELGANSNRAIRSGTHAPTAACSGESRARGPNHLKVLRMVSPLGDRSPRIVV